MDRLTYYLAISLTVTLSQLIEQSWAYLEDCVTPEWWGVRLWTMQDKQRDLEEAEVLALLPISQCRISGA